ncbi:hypothetical protein BH09VER1_BH09VER1_34520 [soil metagenome]
MLRSLRSFLLLLLVFLGACSHNITPYKDDRGQLAVFGEKPLKIETGMASWYNDRRTASGERLDRTALTAAHKTLPFNSHVRVIDLKTGHSIIVRVNDRGPYIRGRIIDLTIGGARTLGIYERGIAKVRIEELREIPLMTKPNLHSTPAQIRRDQEGAAAAKRKQGAGSATKSKTSTSGSTSSTTNKPSGSSTTHHKSTTGGSSTHRTHRTSSSSSTVHRPTTQKPASTTPTKSKTKKKPVPTSSNG